MPTTITSSSGTVYHLWQLPEESAKGTEVGIELSILRNDLGNGYRSRVLYGASTGLRSWSLRLPTLADTSVLPNTVTGPDGETLSREAYLWALYMKSQVTGEPFAYQDPRTGQYYLVEFTNKELKYEKQFRIKLYGTGVELQQVRIPGETVWVADDLTGIEGIFNEQGLFPAPFPGGWGNSLGLSNWPLFNTGNVARTGTQNGLDTMQFNVGATNDGYFAGLQSITLKEAFVVMKMREATFSNNAGVLSTAITNVALVGDVGTTKFVNLGLGSTFEYRKNGVLYTEANQQAPMNTWGMVHVRSTAGFFNGIVQMGKDRNFAGRFAEMDLGEAIFFNSIQPSEVVHQIEEYLTVKWNIV